MEEKTTGELVAKLEALRTKISEVKGKRERVESLPPPVEVAIAKKHKEVDAALDLMSDPEYAIRQANLQYLLIAIFADEIRTNLADHIRKTSRETIGDDEKAARISELDREIFRLEQTEEEICIRLEAEGIQIVRRGDLNPAVFMETTDER
ncbi:MAG: hypothetical protein ACE5JO_02910 [Candidatus Binatia bacterium]